MTKQLLVVYGRNKTTSQPQPQPQHQPQSQPQPQPQPKPQTQAKAPKVYESGHTRIEVDVQHQNPLSTLVSARVVSHLANVPMTRLQQIMKEWIAQLAPRLPNNPERINGRKMDTNLTKVAKEGDIEMNLAIKTLLDKFDRHDDMNSFGDIMKSNFIMALFLFGTAGMWTENHSIAHKYSFVSFDSLILLGNDLKYSVKFYHTVGSMFEAMYHVLNDFQQDAFGKAYVAFVIELATNENCDARVHVNGRCVKPLRTLMEEKSIPLDVDRFFKSVKVVPSEEFARQSILISRQSEEIAMLRLQLQHQGQHQEAERAEAFRQGHAFGINQSAHQDYQMQSCYFPNSQMQSCVQSETSMYWAGCDQEQMSNGSHSD